MGEGSPQNLRVTATKVSNTCWRVGVLPPSPQGGAGRLESAKAACPAGVGFAASPLKIEASGLRALTGPRLSSPVSVDGESRWVTWPNHHGTVARCATLLAHSKHPKQALGGPE